jgi:glycosyltransferase involved in cell wall biosynthesis
MNILQFTLPNHPSLGGIFNVHQDFRRILSAPIVEVVPTSMKNITLSDYQIEVLSVGFLGKYGVPLNLRLTLQTLSTLDIDLVIIHSLFHSHALIAYQFARRHQIPYLFVPHGSLDPYVFSYRAAQKRLWMRLFGQRILDHASAVLCATQKEADKATVFLQKTSVEVCAWGLQMPNLSQIVNQRHEIRAKFGIPLDAKVLLFLGRINRMKRPYETGVAFEQVGLAEWRLVFIGYPEEPGTVRSLLQLSQHSQITYSPPVAPEERWQVLVAADAYVNLGHRENFGYSVVEAALAGLPLLLSEGVDIHPLFAAAQAAQVVAAETPGAIAQGLERFLKQSDAELKAMGQRAQQVAQANFTNALFESRLKAIVARYGVKAS